MLRIFDTTADRTCQRVSRRELLRIGTLGIGGLTLADRLALQSHAADARAVRDKAVVVLFLGGIQLISLGIMGEYLGRLFLETKARPVYVIDKVYEGGRAEEPQR